MQVYNMTHGALPADGRSGLSSASNQQVQVQTAQAHVSVNQGNTTTVNTAAALLPQSPMPPQLLQAVNGAPSPLLEPARVMRVWIAPWIDNKQHLHWPSYVYAEVQPRRWTMGVPDFTQMRSGLPLISRQTPATHAVNQGAGAAQPTVLTPSAGQTPAMPGSPVQEAAPAASGASQ
jgi:conjugal transfer pilus assembly protein TraV